MDRQLLLDVLEYIRDKEKQIDSEWGSCREWEEIVADGDAPALYGRVEALLPAEQPAGDGLGG
jgi:hypothetical protein